MRPEDQRKAEPSYTIIPRVLIFLTHEDEILLLQGAPDKKLWAGKYNGLGGHIEPGETPYQAALRELQEEAGVVADVLTLRAIIHITLPHPPGVMLFVFVGVASSLTEARPSSEGAPVWVNRAALDSLPLVEDLPQLLPQVLLPGPLRFGHYTVTDSGLSITFE